MIKGKSGFLLAEETIKIIIALICLVFLIYVLTSIYYSNKNSKDLKLAQASLDHLVLEVDAGETEVELYNPITNGIAPFRTHWYAFTWSNNGVFPNSCSTLGWERCVCICGFKSFSGFTLKRASETCDDRGVCKELKKDLRIKSSGSFGVIGSDIGFEIKDPPVRLTIDYGRGVIFTQ